MAADCRGFLLVLVISLLTGCVPPNAASVRPLSTADQGSTSKTRQVVERNYVLGTEQSAFVGQPIVKVKDYSVTQSSDKAVFKTPVDISATWLLGAPAVIPAGSELPIRGEADYKGQSYYLVSLPNPTYVNIPMLLTHSGDFENLAMTNGGIVFETGGAGGVDYRPRSIHFTRDTSEHVVKTAGFTNFEIVYGGATKDAINLLYREYTPDDMARPAFTQNLSYDRTSATIRFRELQLHIASANNEKIVYTVEQDGMKVP